MDATSEAADFMVRESLTLMIDGVKLLLKGTGKGAVRSIALIAAVLKSQHRTKGAIRLASMLKAGTPLEIFTIPESQLAQWHTHAKEYGVLYTMVRSKDQDGQVDLVIRKEDAPRVNRILERFHMVATLQASLTSQVQPTLDPSADAPKDEIDRLIDSVLATDAPEATHPAAMTDEEMEGLFGTEAPDAAEGAGAASPEDAREAADAQTPMQALFPEPPSGKQSGQPETGEQGNKWTFAAVNREWPLHHAKEEFTPEQRMEIHKGFAKGLSPEQIDRYALPEYDPSTMAALRDASRPSVAEAMDRIRSQKAEKATASPIKNHSAPEV